MMQKASPTLACGVAEEPSAPVGDLDRASAGGALPSWLRRRSTWTVKALLSALLLGAVVVAFATLLATGPAVPMRTDTERFIPVTTAPVVFGDYRPEIRLYGETIPGQQLELKPEVGGIVTFVSPSLKNGAFVAEGELLFELDTFRYEAALFEARYRLEEAHGRLDELRASLVGEQQRVTLLKRQLALLQADLERAQALRGNDAMAVRTAEDRERAVVEQQLVMAQANTQIELWKALSNQQRAVVERLEEAVKVAERDLADTRVVAPFAGILDEVTIEEGRLVAVNEEVAVLINANWLEARFIMTNNQYGRVLASEGTMIGRPVTIRWNLGGTSLTYEGRVERVGAAIEAASGGVEIFARIDNLDDRTPLRSGAFVEVLVPDRRYANVVRLPEAAVYGSDTVFIVDTESRLEPRAIEVLGRDGELVFVRGNIEAGEAALTLRLPGLGAGVRVVADDCEAPEMCETVSAW